MCFDDSGELNKKRTISFSNGNASTGRDDCTSPSNANNNDDSEGSGSGSSNNSSSSASMFYGSSPSYSNFFDEHDPHFNRTGTSLNVIIGQLVKEGDVEGLDELLKDNDELNIEELVLDNNMRPLHLAISKGRFSMVLFLLSKGVSPNVQDAAGRNAEQWARFCGNSEMQQLLAYHIKSGKQSFIRVDSDNDDSLSDIFTSPRGEQNDTESLGFSQSNFSHYLTHAHELILTPRQVTDIDVDEESAADERSQSTARTTVTPSRHAFGWTTALPSNELAQCREASLRKSVVPCSPLSMSMSSMRFDVDVDCVSSSCHSYQKSLDYELPPSPDDADRVLSPYSVSAAETHANYDESLYDPTCHPTQDIYQQEQPEGDHHTMANDDDHEHTNEVADLVAKASLAVHAAQDEYLRLAASLNIPHQPSFKGGGPLLPPREIEWHEDGHTKVARTTSLPQPNNVCTQYPTRFPPSAPVERRSSFFGAFGRKEKKPTFTRPLRKAASRIRNVMSGRFLTSAQKASPQQAAVFPLSPSASPSRVTSRGGVPPQYVSNPSFQPPAQLAVSDIVQRLPDASRSDHSEHSDGSGGSRGSRGSNKTNDSGGVSMYSDQQTTLTWGTRLRRTNAGSRRY